MPALQSSYDLSALSVATVDQKDFLQSGSIKLSHVTVDGRAVTGRHSVPTKAAIGIEINAKLMEDVSSGNRATLKDVSVFTLGGNTFATYLQRFSFARTCQHADAQGDGSEWLFPLWVGNETSISLEMGVPLGTYPAFIKGLDVAAQAASNLAFSVTLNGTAYTIAAMLIDLTQGIQVGDKQTLSLTLGGRAESSSPAGTSSLLAAALNAPETAVAITTTTKSSNGSTWAGNGLVSAVSYSCGVNELAITDVTYVSQGTWSIS